MTVRPTPLSSALLLAIATPAIAHAETDAAADPQRATELDGVDVHGERVRAQSSKFTAPLLDTPKSVSVISQQVIEQTAATTLLDALRTVPGITFGAGEGGKPTGD
ncbi:MAG TPA: TonB-dependent siderophore receptor, partial [Stenotrophomonas sp.]|nr:TonB-dependent siderophore receptor [Stenotrophomonas sp.]